ncbi:MAG TPA: nitrous oxide reductase accessory protein NosL [Bacteroidia bacterium]|nr:nitrous oxide reductase accessory protein NosL [Bacteroidia bacterium]
MKKLSNLSRFAIGVSSLFIIITYFVPVWRIDLFAPQYPEGLVMKIWLSKLSGDVDIINGLNHYIGMGKIKAEMFPEFSYLVYAVGLYILLALFIAFTGSRKMLHAYFGLSLILALLVLYDFYKWGYHYGHELDPHAPIKVPGMSYQPPIIGHKQLLNFDAYSMPDIGGWIFISFGAIVFFVGLFDWRASRRKITSAVLALIPPLIFLTSCSNDFKPVNYGKDECDNCKMTIVDKKFAVEILSVKGKAFMFDDLICAKQFAEGGKIPAMEIQDIFVNNFNKPGEFLNLNESFAATSESLGSPMGGNMATFATEEEVMRFIGSHGGTSVTSKSIIKTE